MPPPAPDVTTPLSVLLVAENISLRLSGETLVPYYYLDGFRNAGIDVRAICHARVRDDLRQDLDPTLFARMTFVEDSWLQRVVFRIGRHFPYRVEDLIFNQIIHVLTQLRMRKAVKSLIAEHAIDVVFEPAPIAPKALSFLYGLQAPVVIGPMSGAMDLPPAFSDMESPTVRGTIRAARGLADLLHRLVPGKLRAEALIVSNAKTLAALPRGTSGAIHQIYESGVDLPRWQPRTYPDAEAAGPVRFIFCSRFVDWKGIGYLVDAFLPLVRDGRARLDLVGDGELFDDISRKVADADAGDAIRLHGRLPLAGYVALLRDSDVYVTPSLRECGGMAMLEAMAIGLPVVGVDWGGAAQYTTPDCAILVRPDTRQGLIDGLTDAMRRLAGSYPLRRAMGEAARRHIVDADFGWQSRADHVAVVLRDVVYGRSRKPRAVRRQSAITPPVTAGSAAPSLR